MILQERDIVALGCFAQFFMLTANQLREICFTTDSTGRVTRRRLMKMVHEGYVKKRHMQVVNPRNNSAAPVYHLTKQGREFLSEYFDDESYLRKPVEPSQPQHLFHYLAVADFQRLLRKALDSTDEPISLSSWVNEDEPINLTDTDEKPTFLRTKFNNIICRPDGAFVLEYQDTRAVFYLEQDRDTFFHDRVAARKTPGYRSMAEKKGHLQQFPATSLAYFFILVVTPTKRRCNNLRKSFYKRNKDHEVHKQYRFLSLQDLQPEQLLFDPILSCCGKEELVPLVKRIQQPATTDAQAESGTS